MRTLPEPRRSGSPSTYSTCELQGGRRVLLKLPNEKHQLMMMGWASKYIKTKNQQVLVIADSLDGIAGIVGVCWHHETLELEEPAPWKTIRAAGQDEDAVWRVLTEYGSRVLDELHDADFGKSLDLCRLFAHIMKAISANFAPHEEVAKRMGFSEPVRDGNA